MEMKRFQKMNHFPGMSEICRKDLLARNMNRMLKLFPKEYNIFPRTWCLPADFGDFQAYCRTKKNKTYICKPDCGCQGRGIFITKNPKEIKNGERMICQQYICKPFIIDGFKFDLRVYVLLTSCDPYRIFVYNEGLARFATTKYSEPCSSNLDDVCMHLTNYAINKHSKNFVRDGDSSSKRKLSTFNTWLDENGYDHAKVWADIEDVIIKTLISAYPILKHSYRTCFPSHTAGSACFEILGFDVLVDRNLKPWLLEVNHSPSFTTDSKLDREVKDNLLYDTICLINLGACDKRKVIEEDRRRIQERLLHRHKSRELRREQNENNQAVWLQQSEKYEDEHLGGFRRIYPQPDSDKYDLFFKHSGSLFQETVASKAREECARQQLEEIRLKNEPKESLAKSRRLKDSSLQGESAGERPPLQSLTRRALYRKPCASVRNMLAESIDIMKPLDIIEEEELERVSGLMQRENLLRTLGIIEQVYRLLQNSSGVNSNPPQEHLFYGGASNKSVNYPTFIKQACSQEYEGPASGIPLSSVGKNPSSELGILNPPTINWSTLLGPQGQPPVHLGSMGNPSLGMGLPPHRFQYRFPMRKSVMWSGSHNPVGWNESVVTVKANGSPEGRLSGAGVCPRSLSAKSKFINDNSVQEVRPNRSGNMFTSSMNNLSNPGNPVTARLTNPGTASSLPNMKSNAGIPVTHGLTVVSARAPMNQRSNLSNRANILNVLQSDLRRARKGEGTALNPSSLNIP
ncbi:LOW QUALITY PROTEIN: tubulin polyglutamylase ttll6 [Callorhinchus milii]|uniref:LOW QUALITY PROTEIN: tubulin polyglutamylase ttll6 n=1 Tax=Callorhinchus milii TaxID=7868 RepID=UPI001C3FC949|nr:LOW QUALITY PROTEIN: tubulin polyglutamylase ttll6 [Callorhinchus milii]